MNSNARSRMGAYGRIPKALLRDGSLSPRAKVVVAMVDEVAGHEEVTMARLAEWLGCKEDTARAAVREAEEGGWLVVVERYEGGRRAANEYVANAEAHQEPSPEMGGYAPPENGGAPSPETGGQPPRKTGVHIRNETNETLNPSASAEAEAPKKRGCRLPEGWEPGEALVAWARKEHPQVNLQTEVLKFADYWHAKAGAQALKVDWDATFRNWVRTASERSPRFGTSQPATAATAPPPADERREAQRRWLEARGSSLEEYERRKDEAGWMEGLRAMVVPA